MADHRISITLDLTEDELRTLAYEASRFGWLREEPRKRWSTREYKEAARLAAAHIVQLHMDSKS